MLDEEAHLDWKWVGGEVYWQLMSHQKQLDYEAHMTVEKLVVVMLNKVISADHR